MYLDKRSENSRRDMHRAIFDVYYRYVQAIVFNRLRSCCSKEDIEDCVSDVFSAAFIYADKNNISAVDMKGIICGIAVNKASDAYNAAVKRNDLVPIDDILSSDLAAPEDTEAETEKKELRRLLLELIQSLGEPDSTILMEKYYYGRKFRDIAKKLEMKPETVRKRSSRGLERLRKLLAEKGYTKEE